MAFKLKSKWVLADLVIALDLISNLIDKTGYDLLGGVLGLPPQVFNAAVSLLEVGRFIILVNQVRKS